MKNLANILGRILSESMSISDKMKIVFVTFLWALCYPLIKVGLSSGTTPLLFVIGLVAFVGYFEMFVGGSSVNPGLASVIGNSNPIMASLLAVTFLSESLSLIKISGLFFGFISIVLISIPTFYGESSNSLMGIGLVLIGAFGTAAGNVFLKKISKSSISISVLAIQFMLCSVLLFSSTIMSKGPLVIKWNFGFSVSLIVLSVVGTAITDIIWLDLLKRKSLTKLNFFILLTPAFSLVIGMIFFNERLGRDNWAARFYSGQTTNFRTDREDLLPCMQSMKPD